LSVCASEIGYRQHSQAKGKSGMALRQSLDHAARIATERYVGDCFGIESMQV
jgi:hypothetical protein